MANVIPVEFQALFRYDEQWQVLICRVHHAVVPIKSLKLHLRKEHQFHFKETEPLIQAISTVPCCQVKEDLPCPLNNIVPIQDLEISLGYRCPHCDDDSIQNGNKDALSRSEKLIITHISRKHGQLPHSVRNMPLEEVLLQCWRRSWGGGYWTVSTNPGTNDHRRITNHSITEPMTWEEAMIMKERERRQSQKA